MERILTSRKAEENGQTTPCNLLRLPAEIRNQIYHLTLAGHVQKVMANHYLPNKPSGFGAPALLVTCRQIYSESVKMLYSDDIFVLEEYCEVEDTWYHLDMVDAKRVVLKGKFELGYVRSQDKARSCARLNISESERTGILRFFGSSGEVCCAWYKWKKFAD